MLEVRDLRFRYRRGGPMVLRGVDLDLGAGEIGILLGRNGAGKTTLFRCILGLERPEGGTLRIDGADGLDMSRRERARRMAYVPQSPRFGALSVYDTVLMGRTAWFGVRPGGADRAAVDQILSDLGLTELAGRNVEELSGGERQKIAIARALAQTPKLLVFDEPAGNLDLANSQLLAAEARRAAKERGIAVLMSLHDLNQALSLGDRFYLMREGTIAQTGGPEIVTEAAIRQIYGAEVRILDFEGNRFILNGGMRP